MGLKHVVFILMGLMSQCMHSAVHTRSHSRWHLSLQCAGRADQSAEAYLGALSASCLILSSSFLSSAAMPRKSFTIT